jgi:hypothetical protein
MSDQSTGARRLDEAITLAQQLDSASDAVQAVVSVAREGVNETSVRHLPPDRRQLLAAAVVRLSSAHDLNSAAAPLRQQLLEVGDEFLMPLWTEAGCKPQDQTFEKLRATQALASRVDQLVAQKANELPRPLPSSLRKFQEAFMRFLNRPDIKLVVRPFLPEHLLTTRLEAVFTAAQAYIDAPVSGKLRQLQQLRPALQQYSSDAATFGTRYGRELLAQISDDILRLAEEDFLTACGRPAELSLTSVRKKYSLHQAGALDIRLRLRNEGEGHASDVTVIGTDSTGLEFLSDVVVGEVNPGEDLEVDLPALLPRPDAEILAVISLAWTNPDGTDGALSQDIELEPQSPTAEWQSVPSDVYSIEPVMDRRFLVGRTATFDRLIAAARSTSIGSAILTGQKRVGKTSVAKTLQSELAEGVDARDPKVVYIEGGEYIHADPSETIRRLRRRLCDKISLVAATTLKPVDETDATLAPVGDCLDAVLQHSPQFRLLVILDEFDELPLEVYQRGPVGDSLFLGLRYLSNRREVGFLLVGGEKMDFINTYQGAHLNKFLRIQLDYFGRETEWADFTDLVQRPTLGVLEFSEEAVTSIYDWTAGHPYFANLLCRRIWENAAAARDSFVTRREVDLAGYETASDGVSINSFQHFWDDGILESPERKEQVSLRRRQTLVALTETLRTNAVSTQDAVLAHASQFALDEEEVRFHLGEFRRRKVVVDDAGGVRPKVRLFQQWLVSHGLADIITSFATEEEAVRDRLQKESLQVSSTEIVSWLRSVPHFKGRHLSGDDVRAWLEQFGDFVNQRIAFNLLCSISFYSNASIRQAFAESMQTVRRGLRVQIDPQQRRRRDIVVTYLNGPGKSGPSYAKMFSDENDVFHENVIEPARLTQRLENDSQSNALVIVDDFIGTGQSACHGLSNLLEPIGNAIERGMAVFLVAVAGCDEGIATVEGFLDKSCSGVRLVVPNRLGKADRAFGMSSPTSPNQAEQQSALSLMTQIGKQIEPKAPLGYGDGQMLVVFENNCPNNTLPVLWSRGTSKHPWTPLFPR